MHVRERSTCILPYHNINPRYYCQNFSVTGSFHAESGLSGLDSANHTTMVFTRCMRLNGGEQGLSILRGPPQLVDVIPNPIFTQAISYIRLDRQEYRSQYATVHTRIGLTPKF